MAYHRSHGVDTRIVRIFNTYGPRMRPRDGRVVSNFIAQALRGEPLTVYGDGSQTRSFCYVADLVEGIVRLFDARRQPARRTSAIRPSSRSGSSPRSSSSSTGTQSEIVFRPLPVDDPKVRQPDITRARDAARLGAEGRRSRGLRRTIDYFRALLGTSRVAAPR